MPVDYLRTLTSTDRTRQSDVHLGVSLAFIAGSINAGGFLAVSEYTSHMTGVVSNMADELALGHLDTALMGLMSLSAFVLGSAGSAIVINAARRRAWRQAYALPLLIESGLLLAFGLLGTFHHLSSAHVSATVALLCFVMGWQNAMITKVSRAEIRTTHVTGLVTDIGIELGKLIYWNRTPDSPTQPAVRANRPKLRVHLMLVAAFFVGGVMGALGFKHVGYVSTVPLALALAILAAVQFMAPRR
jgi:uncharacterized membrane protein YoaK (UPF0700 family)